MINGFENETAPLADWELDLIPRVAALLSTAYGKDKAVYNQTILALCPELKSGARVRKVINYIRTEGIVPCLIASSKGYFVAETELELLEYEDSLTNRATAIFEVRNKIAEQRRERFEPKQLTLFDQ